MYLFARCFVTRFFFAYLNDQILGEAFKPLNIQMPVFLLSLRRLIDF